MRFLLALSVLVALAASPAMAQWIEQGDAGDLPATAQVPAGAGALSSISGSLATGANDADMYCIRIDAPATFSAATCGGVGLSDSQLFLFKSTGFGVVTNDDGCGAGFLSRIDATLVANQPPGSYLLAVSGYNKDPVSGGGLIFPDTWSGQNGPTGPGGGAAITGWTGTGGAGAYVINLTSCSYCGVTAVEPTTWGAIKSTYR